MYFSEDTAGRVVKELAGRLNEGGYLILDPWATRPCLPESRFQSSQCSYGAVIKKAPGDSRRRQSGATLPSISDPCFSSHPAKTQVTDGDPAASDVLGCARATSALELHEASDREEAMRRARAASSPSNSRAPMPMTSPPSSTATASPSGPARTAPCPCCSVSGSPLPAGPRSAYIPEPMTSTRWSRASKKHRSSLHDRRTC